MTRVRLGRDYRRLFTASVVSNLGDGVGVVAYPWLASAVTRNPLLIALVSAASRLPWLVFTLPAGVITDRVDRRRAMVTMDVLRGAITLVVALVVLGGSDSLPDPAALDTVTATQWGLYLALVTATLLLGTAEVLRDNTSQTILPDIVAAEHLERANGRMWSAEGVANTFVGPPLGALLIAAAFALPFVIDAASFFAAAALVALIPGTFRATRPDGVEPAHWRVELREGVRWLWGHDLLRSMAIILGLMNAAAAAAGAAFVLFAQEVLGLGPTLFAVVGMGSAVGGIVAGAVAAWLSQRLGSGTCLALTLGGGAVLSLVFAFTSHWPVVFVLSGLTTLLGTLWNVITVSLRQTVIPAHLLGRVNSVYRFFAWGMIPIGAALGGLLVVVLDGFTGREWALRSVWLFEAAVYAGLWLAGRSRLTTARLDRARIEATQAAPGTVGA